MDLLNISISNYDYDLPHERIASFPLEERDASRLMVYRDGQITDDQFIHLPHHLENALLVLNNTRVIEARLFFHKPTGGVIEIFCLEPYGQSMEVSLQQKGTVQWLCLIGGASKWKPGQVLQKKIELHGITTELEAHYIQKTTDSFVIEFRWDPAHFSFAEVLHVAGNIPLPPYIKRDVEASDLERYQTVFGREEGSVAAPTAALHFTPRIFSKLQEKNVNTAFITLHVGAGTFRPVKTATIGEHAMHQEPFSISREVIRQLLSAKKVVAVGTTSLRTLESIYWLGIKAMHNRITDQYNLEQWEAYALSEEFPGISYQKSLEALLKMMESEKKEILYCHTSMIIVPGYDFKIPVALITNFHQPQSTLLLLVSAFVGEDWKKIYRHALDHGYRFLSYGDSSLLWKH